MLFLEISIINWRKKCWISRRRYKVKNGWRHNNFIIGKKQSLTNSGPSAKIAGMRKVMRKRSTPQAPSERMIHRLKGHLGEQERKVAFELNRWSGSKKKRVEKTRQSISERESNRIRQLFGYEQVAKRMILSAWFVVKTVRFAAGRLWVEQ